MLVLVCVVSYVRFGNERNRNTHLSITIRCPYVKLSSSTDDSNGVEVDLTSADEFYFACKPYYLHLHLPGRVIDKGLPEYTYDLDTSSFCFVYEKATAHEHFEDLDMISRLLHKEETKKASTGIEEIGQVNESAEENEDDDDDEPLWSQMRQLEIDDQPKADLNSSSCSYGFARHYQGLFSTFDKEYSLIFDNPSPDTLSPASIRQCRLEKEQEDFNEEYYLADKDEFPDQTSILNYSIIIDDQLTDQDRDDLKNLKYKQHLIDDPIPIYLGLIDLLYAFVYDQRVTQGEPCCESSWNIHKLSSTLVWFETFNDLPLLIITCCRRTLIYPLVRSFALARRCLLDVIDILSQGKRAILQCLLQMRRLFLDEEHRYLLNTLYLNDYCLWLQTECQSRWLRSLIDAMKHMIGCELDENQLGLFTGESKGWSWKVNLYEISDSDDDDDLQ